MGNRYDVEVKFHDGWQLWGSYCYKSMANDIAAKVKQDCKHVLETRVIRVF